MFTTPTHTTTTTTTTNNNNNNNRFTAFVWDYPGEPVPEETLTHPPSWSSSNLYQLLPSTTTHSILLVQITCLAIFLHNLFPPLLLTTSFSFSLNSLLFCLQFVSDIAVFVLKRDIKLQPTNLSAFSALTPLVGVRKSIRPLKTRVMRCWHGYLSGARCK